MPEVLTFLASLLTNQPLLQVFVGGSTMMLIGLMVIRGRKDKEALPAPALPSISDVPQAFTQGPREVIDIIREQRDMDRRRTEDSANIRECVRIMRDESQRQSKLLQEMVEDQRVEHRLTAERERRHT